MSKQELTPWFAADVRPVRRGCYEVKTSDFPSPNYRFWTGDGWSGTYETPDRDWSGSTSMYRHGHGLQGWRGLAKKP
jgi:hypothetical protein